MAYNLRSSSIRDELRDEEELEEQNGNESEYVQEEDSSETSEDDVDMEDATLSERLLQSRARGRPSTKLKGKNGFLWDTRFPSRRSDRQSTEVHVPGPKGDAANATTIEEFWSCLFNQEMIDLIVENTNIKIEEECARLVARL